MGLFKLWRRKPAVHTGDLLRKEIVGWDVYLNTSDPQTSAAFKEIHDRIAEAVRMAFKVGNDWTASGILKFDLESSKRPFDTLNANFNGIEQKVLVFEINEFLLSPKVWKKRRLKGGHRFTNRCIKDLRYQAENQGFLKGLVEGASLLFVDKETCMAVALYGVAHGPDIMYAMG